MPQVFKVSLLVFFILNSVLMINPVLALDEERFLQFRTEDLYDFFPMVTDNQLYPTEERVRAAAEYLRTNKVPPLEDTKAWEQRLPQFFESIGLRPPSPGEAERTRLFLSIKLAERQLEAQTKLATPTDPAFNPDTLNNDTLPLDGALLPQNTVLDETQPSDMGAMPRNEVPLAEMGGFSRGVHGLAPNETENDTPASTNTAAGSPENLISSTNTLQTPDLAQISAAIGERLNAGEITLSEAQKLQNQAESSFVSSEKPKPDFTGFSALPPESETKTGSVSDPIKVTEQGIAPTSTGPISKTPDVATPKEFGILGQLASAPGPKKGMDASTVSSATPVVPSPLQTALLAKNLGASSAPNPSAKLGPTAKRGNSQRPVSAFNPPKLNSSSTGGPSSATLFVKTPGSVESDSRQTQMSKRFSDSWINQKLAELRRGSSQHTNSRVPASGDALLAGSLLRKPAIQIGSLFGFLKPNQINEEFGDPTWSLFAAFGTLALGLLLVTYWFSKRFLRKKTLGQR